MAYTRDGNETRITKRLEGLIGVYDMKKAIAILLVLLVAGVAFGAVIDTQGDLTVNATQAPKADFTLTQSTADGAGGAGVGKAIDLDSAAFRTDGVTIAAWTFSSNTKLVPKVTVGWTDFTSSTISTASAVAYDLKFGSNSYESDKSVDYTSFVRQGGTVGPFLSTTVGNFGDIIIKATDSEAEFSEAPDYTSTISFAITAE